MVVPENDAIVSADVSVYRHPVSAARQAAQFRRRSTGRGMSAGGKVAGTLGGCEKMMRAPLFCWGLSSAGIIVIPETCGDRQREDERLNQAIPDFSAQVV